MNSLNDEEIIDIIEEYITSDCKYAVLIDGEWGCGKTYFAENKLIDYLNNLKESGIEKKETIYVSLYGVTSKQEIENKITEKILEQSNETYGKFLARSFKNTKSLSGIINAVTPEPIKKIVGEIDIESIINKFQNVENQILIFDDLERVEMDFNEVFGVINEYVEHKKNKCIIFVNQSEIQKNNIMKNIELKYLTAEILKGINITEKKKEEGITIDKETLKNDVINIYSEDLSYKKIKEKVIGKEIKYIPNIAKVCAKLATESLKEGKTKEILINSAGAIGSIMQREKHCNIRTLKLIIEKFEIIVEALECSEIKDMELYDDILEDVLVALTISLIEKKKNDKERNWKIQEHYMSGSYPEFRFIDNFIMTEKLETEYMIRILSHYNETLKAEREESYNGEIKYLTHNYYMMEDDEIEENLKIIKDKLLKNVYKIMSYPKILEILLIIEKYELSDFNFKEYFELMKKNINNTPGYKTFNAETYLVSDNDVPGFSQYINELKEVLSEEQKHKRILGMNSIINGDENWAEDLDEYLKKYSDYDNNFFIKEIDIELLIETFKIAKTKDILAVRRIFHGSKITEEDIEKIEKFIGLLDELITNEKRKTQKVNFKWLKENLSERVKRLKQVNGL